MEAEDVRVPTEMLFAVYAALENNEEMEAARRYLQIGLRWLTEHPILPDHQQAEALARQYTPLNRDEAPYMLKAVIRQWQKQMFR